MQMSAKQVAAVLVVAISAVACGSTRLRAAGTPHSSGPAPVYPPSVSVSAAEQTDPSSGLVYSGAVTTTRKDPADLGYTLAALSATDRPGVAWTSLKDLCTHGVAECASTGKASVLLARATSTNGAQIQSDGAVIKTVDNKLVYVMYWTGVPCVAVGAPGASSSPTVCVVEDVVDAETGNLLYSGQSSQPPAS